MSRPQRGAPLPYNLLAGVVPCPGGWLAATAKLQGVTIFPQSAVVYPSLMDVLDEKPAFQVVALCVPVGLREQADEGPRGCDREARRLLGWPRSGAIVPPPVRAALPAASYPAAKAANGGGMSPVTWALLPRVREANEILAPYWQRTVFEVHPELSFLQLNDDRSLSNGKYTKVGEKERRQLLEARMTDIERVLDAKVTGARTAHLLDAAIALWTARRIKARSISRVPEDPEWDSAGLRMEILR